MSLRARLTDGSPPFGIALIALAVVSIGMLLIDGARPASAVMAAPFPHFDKVLHLGAHGWSSGLLFWGGILFARPRNPRKRIRLWGPLVLVVDATAGITVEFIQQWLGAQYGRHFDWKDIAANLTGTAIALAISVPVAARLTTANESPAEL
jgi:hypothetical protein